MKKYQKTIKKIRSYENYFEKFRDEDFHTKTDLLKMRLKSGDDLEKILPEAYALVNEAIKRQLGINVFDVQLMGAISAQSGNIVEMKTGEGKTLAIVFVAYLRSLEGKGVHIITANDYLAKRDATWMESVYKMLGVSIGYIVENFSSFDRQVAYLADVTYLTGSEAGFDYLRDNMIFNEDERRHRAFHFAIIDEADSVLIDEAQTPLVISSASSEKQKEREIFNNLNNYVKKLKKGADFTIDQKNQTAFFTIQGIKKLEKLINVENLYGPGSEDEDYLYYFERLLKAYYLFKKDRDYVVEKGRVVIVDEFTGRLMSDHRYFQGLHQAIEAKEGVEIQVESQTHALTTFQHFFKKYSNFAGFTGTAQSSKKELRMIYDKEVEIIPTDKPVVRIDLPDLFFVNWRDKMSYLAWDAQDHFFKNRAMLVGTRSIKKSSDVQGVLAAENIPSNVLNAKHTAREAEIISNAGQPQTVTVATNMAGRGTDIKLHKEVKESGGLLVFGTERHNSKRIDNQLIGRAGRQGDPGQSRFLISAEDELIKIHYKDKYLRKIRKFKNPVSGVESDGLEKIIQKAQKRMEDVFLDQRILSFEFDKALDQQRSSFYRQRQRILLDDNLKEETLGLLKEEVLRESLKEYSSNRKNFNRKNMKKIKKRAGDLVGNKWFKLLFGNEKHCKAEKVKHKIKKAVASYYKDFEDYQGAERMRKMEKIITLKVLDLVWRSHLARVEQIQEAALVNSLSQGNFYDQYKNDMAAAYKDMLLSIPKVLAKTFFRTINKSWIKDVEN